MARFLVKASEFKNVCKAVNDRKLAELKKEIIEILKKQDEKEVKKAIDYFNSQELHYTHLEKSLNGKWIEKAGYGIGTVRIWKGKKYKKIAPGKWARVFDKEGRGTNIAIGKLIAKVQKIDNVEDLMAFVMANKQRFVDENGVDLPVLDKLRAAVDARNGNVGSKGKEYKLGDQLKLKNGKTVEYAGKGKDGKIRYTDRNGSTPITGTMDESEVESVDNSKLSPKEQTENFVIDTLYNKKDSKPAEKKEDDSKAYEGKLATQKQVDEATAISNKYEVSRNEMLKKPITTIQKYANSTVEDFEGGIDKFIEYLAEGRSEGVSMDEVGKEFAKLINHNVARKIWNDYESGALVPDEKGILKPKEESENKTYWIQDFEGNRITSDDAKNKIKSIKDKLEYMESMKEGRSKDIVVSIDTSIRQLENYRDDLISKLDPEDRKEIESEADKPSKKEETKVIENNPKSIEGMEFVNKNKMHVLANFLANHDNVNMATAVIRLQAAYEKLGEEKFLAHFPKDVVERYRKEAGKEETKKESFTPISKDKMKSMSDDELKEYEAKLEKDLLATSRTDPDYVEKYNHWREVHGENNDRFHQAIEDEARAEKQAEADAKSAKEKEINEKYNGYFENRKGLDKARDLKTLEKKYNFDGKVMSSKEFVEQAMDNGVEIKEREVNKLDYPSRTRWNRMNGYEQDEYEKRIKAAGKKTVYSINGFEFPKTVVDYAKFYKEKGKSKPGSEKPSKSEIAIKNKASSLAGAFGYSKNYATKMGAPFNLELAEQTVDEELDWDDGSKKALKDELKRIYSEKKVQKSLFDDFIMDVFEADEDEEIEDAIKADETEYNDYSAEQPELFNSTAMKVREALDRIKNQVL